MKKVLNRIGFIIALYVTTAIIAYLIFLSLNYKPEHRSYGNIIIPIFAIIIAALFCIISLCFVGSWYDVKIAKWLSPYRKTRHLWVRIFLLVLSLQATLYFSFILHPSGTSSSTFSLWLLAIFFVIFFEASVFYINYRHIEKLNAMKKIAKEMFEKEVELNTIIITTGLRKQELREIFLRVKSEQEGDFRCKK